MSQGGLHTERFSGRVRAYVAYRPRFPREILAFLQEHGALPEGVVADFVIADIGAGTGMLAEVFLEAGHPVIAVEPNREMLDACSTLAAQYSALQVIQGQAEATTLPPQSVDLIVVGRAMHWFDLPRAHREFQRILRSRKGRPGWVLVATSGHRDSGAAVSQLLSDVLRRYRMDSFEAEVRRDFDGQLAAFLDDATWHRTKVNHTMSMTFDTLLGYSASLSAIPHAGQPGYEAMVAELRTIFDAHQKDGVLETPLSSSLYLGHLRAEYASAAG